MRSKNLIKLEKDSIIIYYYYLRKIVNNSEGAFYFVIVIRPNGHSRGTVAALEYCESVAMPCKLVIELSDVYKKSCFT